MKRRDVVVAPLALSAATLAWTQVPGRMYRVGYLGFFANNSPSDLVVWNAFINRLSELGYRQGSNLIIDDRYAEGRNERYAEFAADMVKQKVDIVVASSGNSARAVMAVSRTTPIVTTFAPADPVRAGLIASFAHPGGQLTGITSLGAELVPKHIQLLKETLPKITRMAYAWCPQCGLDTGLSAADVAALQSERMAAARSLGVTLVPLEVNAASDFDAASAKLLHERAEALVVGSTSTNAALRDKWNALAAQHRLPTIAESRGTGKMISYGADPVWIYRRAAEYVAKILGGEKPGDIPMEQPTRFDFVVNLKMAKAFGITIPPIVLLQATELIE